MIRKRWFRRKKTTPSVQASSPERLVRVGCPAHNCGGRCLLVAHIQEDASGRRVITRLDTDDRPDTLAAPQLRACVRGRAYLRRQYHPDRLQYPMKRVGERGEGQFERMSWDEALDTVAVEMQRVKESYGNSALFVPYGTGSYNQINGSQTARRLMNLFGGCLGIYNSYSWAAINIATPTVYGTLHTGNQRQGWLNARLILMWGWNPAEMRDGTNSDYFVKLARERGARVVCIDPRHTLSAASLADEWVPIRPGTDTAMMSAMAYVMIVEHLCDTDFVRTHCVGFDQSQMPEGAEGAESYRDYSLGSRDGIPKTPEWAEAITTVPRQTIVRIAREYATIKPSILYQGYGMQRRAYGEQVVRAGCVLAAITGNVGVPGGWASGLGLHPQGGPLWNVFPVGENPIEASIPVFLWSEAVLRGAEMGPEEGVIGVDRLDNNIKLIYAVATNALVNQHANINRSAKILRDESLVEFVAVQDNFLTPTGRFADVLLPACTQFETWGVEDGWKYGSEVILMPQLVEPLGESKSDYRICAELAERLGFGEAYTEGRSERAWVEWILDHYRKERFPDLPTLDEFEAINIGAYVEPADEPAIAFADFCADPDANWLLEKVGWTPAPLDAQQVTEEMHGGGILTHGGSIANLTALIAARTRIAPEVWREGNPPNLVLLAPPGAHYSIARAAGIMGLGHQAVYALEVGERGLILPDRLPTAYARVEAEGKRAVALIANAGTTAVGLYDPLQEIGVFCREHNLWLHVDGAHGGPAILTRKYRHLMRGIELADSVVMNMHKLMRVTAFCTAMLVRDARTLDNAFSQDASYLFHAKAQPGYDFHHRTIECTKPVLGLKFFMVLAAMGEAGMAEYIEGLFDLTAQVYDYLQCLPDFECPVAPQSNILCFRVKGVSDGHLALRDRLLARGTYYVSSTLLHGRRTLRLTLTNPATGMEEIRGLVAEIRELVGEEP